MEKILWTSTSPTEARANAWTQPRSQSPSLLSRRMFRVPRGWRAGQERGGLGTCSPGWPPETGRSLTPGFKLPPELAAEAHLTEGDNRRATSLDLPWPCATGSSPGTPGRPCQCTPAASMAGACSVSGRSQQEKW